MLKDVSLDSAERGQEHARNLLNADLAKDVASSYPDGNVVAVGGDVSNIDTWHNALKTALDRFGKLDIVVNNAGVVQKATPSHEVDEAEFDRLIRINVKPLFLSCKAIVPYLRDEATRRIDAALLEFQVGEQADDTAVLALQYVGAET